MSLGIIGGLNSSAGIVSPNKTEHPNHWYTPTKNPNEIMKQEADKFIKKQEEKSKSKPAEERNVGDWINVASSYVRKFVNIAENSKKY
ncbi:hypothetical protein IJ843_01610 [bacterium]|nr:hypothetical protein [bacterium]